MHLSFHKKLFYSISGLFLIFLGLILLFQYNRERTFKKELLGSRLQRYNREVYNRLPALLTDGSADSLLAAFGERDLLRITVLDPDGRVLFDNRNEREGEAGPHLNRKEITEAVRFGSGNAIRESETLHVPYFYAARDFGNYIVRTALPFDTPTIRMLDVDRNFLYFISCAGVLFLLILYRFSSRLGKSISRLQLFLESARQGLPVQLPPQNVANEIGKITNDIIAIYHHLLEAQEELSIEKEKLIKHLQFSNEGVAVFNGDRKKIVANNLFIQYLNLIADREIRNAEAIFEVPEFRKIVLFIASNAQKQDREGYRSHLLQIAKNGKTFQCTCVLFDDGSFEIVVNDITQQEEESRLKRQLTQNIAHELKTPVSSIQGYMETILSQRNMPEESRERFLNRCYAQTVRLGQLLGDISMLNRMDESNDLFEKEPVNLRSIIDEVAGDTAVSLQQREMELTVDAAEELPMEGNPSLLYSIFRNLTDNAVAYAGERTRIAIRCYLQENDYYYFSFSDSGVGVPEEHLNRLFERFYRVDKGRSRKAGGTGLGLAIVKNAVHFHQGEISAKERPGGGLEFLFSLKRK